MDTENSARTKPTCRCSKLITLFAFSPSLSNLSPSLGEHTCYESRVTVDDDFHTCGTGGARSRWEVPGRPCSVPCPVTSFRWPEECTIESKSRREVVYCVASIAMYHWLPRVHRRHGIQLVRNKVGDFITEPKLWCQEFSNHVMSESRHLPCCRRGAHLLQIPKPESKSSQYDTDTRREETSRETMGSDRTPSEIKGKWNSDIFPTPGPMVVRPGRCDEYVNELGTITRATPKEAEYLE